MNRKFVLMLALVGTASVAAPVLCHAKSVPREPEIYDISSGKPVQIAAKKTKLPLIVYGESAGQSATFVPSGYMGDASALKMTSTDFSAPLSSTDSARQGSTCLKIQYTAKGPAGWAGIFWMTPANNWGKIKGAGYDLTQAKKLTFWMKGEKGGERIAAIKFGGIVGPYPDTDSGSLESIRLGRDWKSYEIPLDGKDMRHIVGGFMFSVTRGGNPRGAIFYLDEIAFEGDGAPAPSVRAPTQPNSTVSTVAVSSPAATSTPVATSSESKTFVVAFPNVRTARSPEFERQMKDAIDLAVANPTAKVQVTGYTDSAGPADVNRRVSLERAKTVADYLQTKGVAADRITVRGLGPDNPLTPDSNETAVGRMRNRRVEIAIGGQP